MCPVRNALDHPLCRMSIPYRYDLSAGLCRCHSATIAGGAAGRVGAAWLPLLPCGAYLNAPARRRGMLPMISTGRPP